ncbi:MAG: alpha/beta hydrolase [Gemmatimonadota bacterium]|nr:alpha/beta hydrolase [Gemmatimonadota bacterium]
MVIDVRSVRRHPFVLTGSAGFPIRGEAIIPANPIAGVIVCHGFKGFARWGFFPFVHDALAAAGIAIITFNFSGSGAGADGESFTDAEGFFGSTFSRDLDDVAQVVAEATARSWIGERYGSFGHSRGGGIAILHAARDERVAALATWAAISRVSRWSSEDAAAWRARGYTDVVNSRTGESLRLGPAMLADVDHRAGGVRDIPAAAGHVRAPWLIVHGTADDTVPLAEGELLDQRRGADPSRTLFIEGAGHTFDVRHPMPLPSPALKTATARTVALLRENLG